MGHDPLGRDFITAPEVSQIFGELIGLFLVQAWEDRGQPGRFSYLVELGPGRGTLMMDLLRTAAKVRPGFVSAVAIVLIEASPVLRDVQAKTLAGIETIWAQDLREVPDDAPLFLIANEFFDALADAASICENTDNRREAAWQERMVDRRDARGIDLRDGTRSRSRIPHASSHSRRGGRLDIRDESRHPSPGAGDRPSRRTKRWRSADNRLRPYELRARRYISSGEGARLRKLRSLSSQGESGPHLLMSHFDALADAPQHGWRMRMCLGPVHTGRSFSTRLE